MTPPRAIHGDPAKVLDFARRLVLDHGDVPTSKNMALVLHVSQSTIQKWSTHPGEGIRLHILDRIATEHGRHYSAFLPDGEWEATG